MQKHECIPLLTEVFRNVKILMHQPYKELIYKSNLSFKRKKKMQNSIFFHLVY